MRGLSYLVVYIHTLEFENVSYGSPGEAALLLTQISFVSPYVLLFLRIILSWAATFSTVYIFAV